MTTKKRQFFGGLEAMKKVGEVLKKKEVDFLLDFLGESFQISSVSDFLGELAVNFPGCMI